MTQPETREKISQRLSKSLEREFKILDELAKLKASQMAAMRWERQQAFEECAKICEAASPELDAGECARAIRKAATSSDYEWDRDAKRWCEEGRQ